MTDLPQYLAQKRQAILRRRSAQQDARRLSARVTAEGRSGVRRIRIRDFQLVSDSEADFAGYDLGPSSPELQLGVLGSCLTHTFLIQAAELQIGLDSIEVAVEGTIDPRAGSPGFETVPRNPHGIRYTAHIQSDAGQEALARLREAVERTCPILQLLRNPQSVSGTLAVGDAVRQSAG